MWTPNSRSRSPFRALHRLFQVIAKARHRITLRNVLSLRKWQFLFERFKREIIAYRDTFMLGAEFSPVPPAEAYILNNTLRPDLEQPLRNAVEKFSWTPKISIVMPVYNVDPRWLDGAIQSVVNQVYPHWELCIADDASTRPETLEVLRRYEGKPGIKIHYRTENGHICAASNSAAAMATGDFLALLDNDDLLEPRALFEIARLLDIHPDADLIYTDEDKIDTEGRHYDLHFKPDWSPVLLLAYNYINHLTCIRRRLFEDLAGFIPGMEGAQDYDLLLRITEKTDRIFHIPKVLHHWRAVPESTASAASVKPIVDTSATSALKNRLARTAIPATLYRPEFAELHGLPINQLEWSDEGPSVEIVLFPGADRKNIVRCITSIESKTTYRNYRLTTGEVESAPAENPASRPAYLNGAARHSTADILLFLSADLEILEPHWLSRLVGYLGLPGIGAAGARIIGPDGNIAHAGMLLSGPGDAAPGPAFFGSPARLVSYFFLAETTRETSAVSAACLLTRRATFHDAGGFDESFGAAGFDVDYCLRVARQGLRTVYVAGAELRSTAPLDGEIKAADAGRPAMPQGRLHDGYHNPNLLPGDFTVDPASRLDYADILGRKLKCAFFTHNLNFEGAPKVILNLAAELNSGERISSLVVSPHDGPAREFLRVADVPVEIISLGSENILQGWADAAGFRAMLDRLCAFFEQLQPDVIVANVLNSFFVVEAAARLNIPCVWIIHESYDRGLLVRSIQSATLKLMEQAFVKANAVVFVSDETRRMYSRYNVRRNFRVINNALSPDFIDTAGQPQGSARERLGIPDGKKVILSVGTVCERKDQQTLIRAVKFLATSRDDFLCYIVGVRATDRYPELTAELVDSLGLRDRVFMIPETPDVASYYGAADIFAFTSLNESYSLTILEAMAFGLPIVTTACCGVSEQVRFGTNALCFPFQDHKALAKQLALLLDDDEKRYAMGRLSRSRVLGMPDQKSMIQTYEALILSSWQVGSPGRFD